MIHWLRVGFVAVLFVALTPGVLVTLPPKGKPMVVLAVHAVLFAVLLTVLKQYRVLDGFVDASGNAMPMLGLPKAGFANKAGFADMEKEKKNAM